MAIPESQLETWSHQGSVSQSASTYQTIRSTLLDPNSGYADKKFNVFLQGSYGNDTNIYAESDVDVVICLQSTFHYDLAQLNPTETSAYLNHVTPATYSREEFKNAVIAHLKNTFGADSISVGPKAIKINANNNRRSADIIVCCEYRRFKSFSGIRTSDYVTGIAFQTPSGDIINYPKQHSENLTAGHQASNLMLKPMVRILKNMRSRMVDAGVLGKGVAPSYYIEGLLYNVPADQFVETSYTETFINSVNWLISADRSKLVCVNWQYYLLGNSSVQWNKADLDAFLGALCKMWNDN